MGIAIFIFFIAATFYLVKSLRHERSIFDEFSQSQSLILLVLLFPFGPAALLVLPHILGWLPAAFVAAICYIPAFINSRKRISTFECSGTDRTKQALKVSSQAFGIALVGIIQVLAFVIISAGSSSI